MADPKPLYIIKDIRNLKQDEDPLKAIFANHSNGFIEIQGISNRFFIQFDTDTRLLSPIPLHDKKYRFITTTITPPDGMLEFLRSIMDSIIGKKDLPTLK